MFPLNEERLKALVKPTALYLGTVTVLGEFSADSQRRA